MLQRRRREWRRWILAALATLYVGNREGLLPLQVIQNAVRLGLVRDLGLFPVDVMELRRELLLVFLEQGFDGPVLDGLERTNLSLPLDDEP